MILEEVLVQSRLDRLMPVEVAFEQCQHLALGGGQNRRNQPDSQGNGDRLSRH